MKKTAVLLICFLLCAALPIAQAEGFYTESYYGDMPGAYEINGLAAGYGSAVPGAEYVLTGAAAAYSYPVWPVTGTACGTSAWFREFTGYVNGYRINVRSCPGTSGTVCGVVSYGDKIHVTNWTYVSGNKLWYYGSIGCLCGWIFSGYVGGAPAAPACPAVTACTLPCGWGTVRLNGTNFRCGPGMGYRSMMQLRAGTAVQLLSAANDGYGTVWYQAAAGGCTGWIRGDLVTPAGGTAYAAPAPYSAGTACFTGYTNTNAVNIRVSPNGAVVMQVGRGTAVYVSGVVCQYGVYWYQVRFYGGYGYVRADLVSGGPYGVSGAGTAGAGINYYDYSNNTTIIGDGSAFGGVSEQGYGYTEPSNGYTDPAAGGYFGGQSGSVQTPQYGYSDAGGLTAGTDVQAAAAAAPACLSFTTCSLAMGQTLPVYSAPNAESLRADSGTAQVTLTESVYAAGFDGQWLLVMYRNQNKMVRVGYVNAFQLQGALPNIPSLTFGTEQVLVKARTAVTSDPMEQTDALMMLNAGDTVTLLGTLSMNGSWAYVETMYNGTPVRGFIPVSAIRSVSAGEEIG